MTLHFFQQSIALLKKAFYICNRKSPQGGFFIHGYLKDKSEKIGPVVQSG